ncbi:hypothetical protein F441_13330 [Phytophthora nicotianae CJ01A1]|uniref:START domain-containing protein n=2 Tax=Phytophthora nicotianae TaxID=4792 RepID=W2GEL2_PHYNI|nr:hypothetical protein L915_13082 [Phytophthora nicotianae]ETP11135.1 hypothetical protein F441_13330 [Phytophthora nicotianae CJ01A1]KUG01243.1 hypothetical protein AM587_10006328 [Phytophthora nicotianae]
MDGSRGVDDESFLADLNGFLHDCGVPDLEITAPNATDLLQDSDHLLAETEALLASYNTSIKTHKTPEELRHELRIAQAAKRRHRYRVKIKNERQTLQEQEKTLSEELKALQRARKKTRTIQENCIAVPLWKAIASRQMDGRLIAEEQERRLKCAVVSRAKVIQEVNNMMQQQLNGVSSPNAPGMTKTSNDVELDADDIALFEEYLQDMDEVYKQTDEAFEASGVEENPLVSYKEEPKWKRDGDLEYFENLDVSLIPSSFEKTSSAMWQAMLHVHRQKDRQHYRGVIDPENTIAVKCRIPSPKETGERVDMLIHLVIKRYIEADRVVTVWRALTEGDAEFAGMHSDETGWCIVRPTSTVDSGATVTVIQTFTRFIPMAIATTFSNKAHADQFAKLVVTSGEEDGSEITRMMASLLIEDPLEGQLV